MALAGALAQAKQEIPAVKALLSSDINVSSVSVNDRAGLDGAPNAPAIGSDAKAESCQASLADAWREPISGTGPGPHEAPSLEKGYKPIARVKFQSVEKFIEIMKPLAKESLPLVIEGSDIINPKRWVNLDFLRDILKEKTMLVKRSPSHRFRYFDLKKNQGNYDFKVPLQELQRSLAEFHAECEDILSNSSAERMYLQETLSGHSEMAEEFSSWRWELLVRVSSACGWGLPDSNELFIGMEGVETPLHFDERENLFYQVRGRKEIVVFPFTDYTRMYMFPTSHPCDRQSMVGNPFTADLTAFPRFAGAVGYYTTLQAGDLLYLPYGWFHWLRNVDHFCTSVSFWSTTPSTDLSQGVPSVFTEHMLTRVRRNLESMLATQYGPEQHNETMLLVRDAILKKRAQDPQLMVVRSLLAAVKMPPQKQDIFLLEMIEGRFGIDWNAHV